VADHLLALFQSAVGVTASVGGLAGITCNLLDGGLQFAEGIADLRGVAGLAFGAAVQAAA
jgi:hypothetical protein